MKKTVEEHKSGLFKDNFDSALEILAKHYNIDTLYVGDMVVGGEVWPEELGICSIYIPFDIRDDSEKSHAKCFYGSKEEMRGYDPGFARHLFKIDGKTIDKAQFTSIFLKPEHLEGLAKNNNVPLKVDYSKLVYEILAVRYPKDRDFC